MSIASRPGRIRIIAGRWRGRFIPVPKSPGLRPTPNRVRETLFNWLAPEIEGTNCLDLYAGTGALGIEALSRGAASVTFVEPSKLLVPPLQIQLEELGASARVVHTTAEQLLADTQDRFDIVFADPPFGVDPRPVWKSIARILRAGGAFYCERDAGDGLPDLEWGTWQRRAKAGDVCFGLARADRDD
jgi:16S rRNA (guanine966-N2)-methyltransferase